METVMDQPAGVATAPAVPPRTGVLPAPAAWCVVVAGAFLAGVLTSVGQASPATADLANSAGPWFVVAVGLLLVVRPRLPWAMPLGVGILLVVHVGYWAASNLRGHPDSLSLTNPWLVLSLPAGLLAGAVAAAVRGVGRDVVRRRTTRAVALGVSAAVLAGEGARGLLQVTATTGAAYWVVELVTGAVVLGVGLLVARSQVGRVLALGTALVGTAVVLGAFLLLGSA